MEAKPKKERTHTPRSATHQAVLDAVHEFCKKPFADQTKSVLQAMLEHKRMMYGDPNISTL